MARRQSAAAKEKIAGMEKGRSECIGALEQRNAELATERAARERADARVKELEALILADECEEHCVEVCCQSGVHAEARAILARKAGGGE